MTKTVTYKGGLISYKVDKKNSRNVVLLHGFLESKETWNHYHKELAKTNTVLSIDLLGHGASDSAGYIHTMEEMAEVVNLVLKTEKIRKAILVGHSMGGYVALAFSEMFPDNMSGLCLFNSSAKADTHQKKLDRDRAIKVIKRNHNLFIKQAIPNLFYSDPNKKKTKKYEANLNTTLQIALKTPKQGIIAALEGMKLREEREIILRFAHYPILFIIGKHDPIIPYDNLMEQTKLSENTTYYVSEKGGHLCFLDDTKACLTVLQKFIIDSKKK